MPTYVVVICFIACKIIPLSHLLYFGVGKWGYMQALAVSAAQCVILLVDDEPLVRMGVAFLLEELGYLVWQASTAAQALEILSENPDIDILMTDFRMPDVDGLEMIARAKEVSPSIRAVLMTGYAVDDDHFNSSDTPRLAKPFGITELEQALKQGI